MRLFKFLMIVTMLIFVVNCKKTINIEPKEVVYDRDVCKRCVMAVGDRLHSAQIINPDTGEYFFFDDLGCAILWLEENNFDWNSRAVIYFTDGTNGEWVNSNNAKLAKGYITPMSFGIAAFKNEGSISKDKTTITYEEAKDILLEIKKERMMKKHGKIHE